MECEHLFETSNQRVSVGFMRAVILCLICAREDVAVRDGTSRKLTQKRKEHVMATFFFGVPKIEIEVSQGGQTSLPQQKYVLDDRRAIRRSKFVKCEPKN